MVQDSTWNGCLKVQLEHRYTDDSDNFLLVVFTTTNREGAINKGEKKQA